MKSRLENFLERLGSESRIHFGLEAFQKALDALGNPEKTVKSIVIGGTNGKGTVSLLLSAALKHAGFTVGTYLSPHLQHFTERYLHNGKPASLEQLEPIAADLETLSTQYGLSYFEFQTLLCLLWSKACGHDYLVLEVGLGGRLDATNVTSPLATCITNIDLDHEKWLGMTRDKILTEKMGILRPGTPLYSNVRFPALMAQLEARCRQMDVPLTYGWKNSSEWLSGDWLGQRVRIGGHSFSLTNPSVGTLENATLAYSMVRGLFPAIGIETIQKAFAGTRNPGRMEVVQKNPRVVLSGDHNLAGLGCLAETLERMQAKPKVICGFSPDKPYKEMVHRLKEMSSTLTLTQIARLQSQMPDDYGLQAPFVGDAKTAVEQSLASCNPEDTLLITGSLYLVGEVRELWHPAGVKEPLF